MKERINNLRKIIIKKFGKSKIIKALYCGPIKKANRVIRKWSIPEFTEMDGFKIYLDKYDTLNLSLNHTCGSEFFKNLLRKNVTIGKTVLNVGANIGCYTLFLSKLVGKKGKVYAFEPAPENFKILRKNIETNGLKQTKAINKAVSDRSGKVKLFLADYNQGDHRIWDSGEGRQSVEVEQVSMDDFFTEKTKVDFILIDAQGADFSVFRGLKKLIKNNPELKIIIEFSPYHLKKFKENPREFLREIRRTGFKIFDIDEEEEKLVAKTEEQLIKKYVGEKFTNLFLTKHI